MMAARLLWRRAVRIVLLVLCLATVATQDHLEIAVREPIDPGWS
jgi:hypothetical protein